MNLRAIRLTCISMLSLFAVAAPPALGASTGGTGYQSGSDASSSRPSSSSSTSSSSSSGTTRRPRARLVDGLAQAPAGAPEEVKQAIAAANQIVGKPYRYGGGHAKVDDTGYDCSGTISFALIRSGLLASPLDSSSFMRWGARGRGEWITVYTNPGHAYVVIAGLRLDTSAFRDPSGLKGPRWRPAPRPSRGFTARHPAGL